MNLEEFMKTKIVLVLMLLLSIGFSASAVELKVNQDQLIETGKFTEDYLFQGEDLQFKGQARDLFFVGQQVDFTGDLALGLFAGGETVNVSGTVNNGVKAGARTINIDGLVTGTSFLGAEKVNWGPDSQAIGDTFIGARKVRLQGKMKGDLYVGAAEVSITNVIEGDVKIRAGQIKISEQGKIVGNLHYSSDEELSADEASRVSGEIIYSENDEGMFKGRHDFKDRDIPYGFMIVFKIALAILGFIILLLPVTKGLEKQLKLNEVLSYSLWGLIPIFMYPTIIVFSILLIITIPLAGTMLLAFVPLILITKTIGLTLIGGYLANQFNLNIRSRFLLYLIGIVLYSLLSAIPYFGFLLLIFVSSIGCGLGLTLLLNRKPAKGSF